MTIRSHGGSCCGMRHSVGWSMNNDKERIYRQIWEDKASVPAGRLIEVVVTNGQLSRQPNLGPALAAEGFVLVNSFKNDNSGNICNVFHYIRDSNKRRIRQPRPDPNPWQAPPPPDSPEGWRRVRPEDFAEHVRRPIELKYWNPSSPHYPHNNTYRYTGKGMASQKCNVAWNSFPWDKMRIRV